MPDNKILEKLVALIGKKIKEMNKVKDKKMSRISSDEEYISGIIESLNKDPYSIADFKIIDVIPLFRQYSSYLGNPANISMLLDNLVIPIEAAKGKKRTGSSDYNFNEEEIGIINAFIEDLEKINEAIQQNISVNRRDAEIVDKKIEVYTTVYDKLRQGETAKSYIDENDIDVITSLISDLSIDEQLGILLEINKLNTSIIFVNRSNDITELDDFVEEDEEETKMDPIDEEILRSIFESNGFNYDQLSKATKQKIRTKCKMKKITSILSYLDSDPDYIFLKYFDGNKSKLIYEILRYSSPAILKYLRDDARKNEIDLKDVFDISGIFRRNNSIDDDIIDMINTDNPFPDEEFDFTNLDPAAFTGTGRTRGKKHRPKPPVKDDDDLIGVFDNFKTNSELLSKYNKKYPGLYHTLFVAKASILASNCDRFEHNLKIIENYRLVSSLDGAQPLMDNHLDYHIDRFLETGKLTGYIRNCLSSVYYSDKFFLLVLTRARDNTLEVKSNKAITKLRVESKKYDGKEMYKKLQSDCLEDFLKKFPDDLGKKIYTKYNDDYLSMNDEIIEILKDYEVIEDVDFETIKDNELREKEWKTSLVYDINGVYISINKFKRVWAAIKDLDIEGVTIKDKLIYALTYQSLFTVEQYKRIDIFINDNLIERGL